MSVLNTSDFSDYFHRLSQSEFNKDSQQTLIDTNEKGYIARILGADLGQLFCDDLVDGVPQTQRFIDIFDPFIKQYENHHFGLYPYLNEDCLFESKGMKWILKGLIYYDFVSPQNINSTDVGMNTPEMENNRPVLSHDLIRVAEKRWNDAIESIEAVQKFICENSDVYPEYEGIHFKFRYSSLF